MSRPSSRTETVITSIANLIETIAEGDQDNPHRMRMVLLDAIVSDVIWGLGTGYDHDVILSRHCDNVAMMLREMNEATYEEN